MAAPVSKFLFLLILTFLALNYNANGEIHGKTQRKISRANRYGPYLGIVIPNQFELNPLLQHPSYTPHDTIDFAGRRFRFGSIAGQRVVMVMTGLSLINAGITTQLLLSLFRIKGVVHYGLSGNADPSLHIGDVTIPQSWGHTGLWSWQRFGFGPEDELPLEAAGDYSREFGYLKFADYAVNVTGCDQNDNLLNNIWYQQEEIFPIDGTPEERQHILWVPVDAKYFDLASKLEGKGLELQKCINSTTCLFTTPKVARIARGASSSIYLDNSAYRTFLNNKFNVSPVDMESAAVALICYQQRVPFIIIRALSDLAGGGSAQSNEADTFIPLAANNSVTVLVEFVKLLNGNDSTQSEEFSL
ncbi:Adenosylhomocysteine nucleosidase [Handroanthus impetiginosus]|uniref:Adenosylhomocysteine nucleosidase n=1 Tax=Handroanthus impetiginosus TaxID=429701 RepID=A0A2G9G6D6_9LAMI|nr:Adenosylhomocysteine nucleosidase [Handroanthus impetiginosus]